MFFLKRVDVLQLFLLVVLVAGFVGKSLGDEPKQPITESPTDTDQLAVILPRSDAGMRVADKECLLVDFGEKARLLGRYGGVNQTDLLSVDLPDGEYEIVLGSEDNLHGTTQATQPFEQWQLQGFDSNEQLVFTTSPSDDLPDAVKENSTRVGSYPIADIASIRAIHAHVGSNFNSVVARTVAFQSTRCSVNAVPVAIAQQLKLIENQSVSVTLSGSDEDGDALTFRIVNDPMFGTLSGDSSDLFYTPNLDYQGTDQFTFQVSDGQDTSATATVDIAIVADNAPPVANPQSIETQQDQPIEFFLTGSDANSDTLTYKIVDQPSNGTISVDAALVIYSPNPGFFGQDKMSFVVNDGTVNSSPSLITIDVIENVNQPPTVSIEAETVIQLNESLSLVGTVNDDGLPLGNVLTILWSQTAGPGIVTFSDSGETNTEATFSLPGNYILELTASDGELTSSSTHSVIVEAINSNDPPVILSNPPLSAIASISYRYQVLAQSQNVTSTLTYSLLDSPPGMSIDADTGLISWVPAISDIGQIDVKIEVNDGMHSTVQMFVVTVVGVENACEVPINSIESPITDPNDDRQWQGATVGTFAQLYFSEDTLATRQRIVDSKLLDDGAFDITRGTKASLLRCDGCRGVTGEALDQTGTGSYDYSILRIPFEEAGNDIDSLWLQTGNQIGGAVWDLGVSAPKAAIFNTIDHGPIPGEAIESTVYLSNDPSDPDSWVEAITEKVWLEGFKENRGILWDGLVYSVGTPSNENFRYVSIIWGGPGALLSDGDNEINGVMALDADFNPVEVCTENLSCPLASTVLEPATDRLDSVNLTRWQASTYLPIDDMRNVASDWTLSDDGSTVLQATNSYPTIFYSDVDALNSVFEGTISTDASDNDFMGFVIGFNPGDETNPAADYLLIDWKQEDQTYLDVIGRKGLAVSKVTGIPIGQQWWGHVHSDATDTTSEIGVREIARAITLSDAGYEPTTEYNFRFEFANCNSDSQSLLIYVNGVLEFEIEEAISNGRFGFYNYSKPRVQYSGFSSADLTQNQAPVVTIESLSEIPPDSELSLLAVVSDDGLPLGGELMFRWRQLEGPGRVAFSNSTQIQTTATFPINGKYIIQLRTSDGQFETVSTQAITVTNPNNLAPVITSNPQETAVADAEYTYAVVAEDSDVDDVLSYSLIQNPEGMLIDSETGVISWVPTQQQIGSSEVNIQVTDLGGLSATQNYAITVVEPVASIVVPDVTGLLQSDAIAQLGSAAFLVGSVASVVQPGLVPGTVVEQVPAAGSSAPEGSSVNLVVAVPVGGLAVACEILLPEVFSELRVPTTITANLFGATEGLNSTEPLSWDIHLFQGNSPESRIINSGSGPLAESSIANLDPTLLANDRYRVELAYRQGELTGICVSEYVVVGNFKLGNFRLDIVDLIVPVAGIPLSITRSYDTLDLSTGDFGNGWRLGFPGGVRESVGENQPFKFGTKVFITKPDGRTSEFTFTPEGNPFFPVAATVVFTPEKGSYDTLEAVGFTDVLNFSGQYFEDFGTTPFNPTLYKLTTREGVEYLIDQAAGLQSVSDQNGNVLTLSSTGINHSSGTNIVFDRDAQNRIRTITDPSGNVITYNYDENGDLVSVVDQESLSTQYTYYSAPAHYIESIIDQNGATVFRATFDDDGRLASTSDAFGNTVFQEFDPSVFTQTLTDAAGNITRVSLDERGNVLRLEDAEGGVTAFEYADTNNPDSITKLIDPNANETTYGYDSNGNLSFETDALGNTSEYEFTAQGQLSKYTDRSGAVTQYTYQNKNITSITNALGHTAVFTYMDDGKLNSITDFEKNTKTFEYDGACNCDRPTQQTNSDGTFKLFGYNGNGLPTSITDESGAQRVFDYFKNGLVKTVTDEMGNTTSYTYTNNNVSSITNAQGVSKFFEYNANGQLAAEISPAGAVTNRQYDSVGNLVKITDALGNETSFEFDGTGRITTRVDSLGKVDSVTYDNVGNINSHTDRNGRQRDFTYDALNNIQTEEWISLTNGESANRYQYSYNNNEQLISIANDEVTLTYSYFADGALKSETSSGSIGNPSNTLSYAYNRNGKQLDVVDTEGVTLSSEYDDRSRLVSRIWNGNGAIPSRVNFSYNARGDLELKERFANTSDDQKLSESAYSLFDDRRLIANIAHTQANGTLIPDVASARTFNDIGQIVTEEYNGNSAVFVYDNEGQLESRSNSVLTDEFYSYDLNGNRTNSHLHGTNYQISAGNRLDTNGDYNYVYDTAGNLIEKEALLTGAVVNYEWDHRGRLSKVSGELIDDISYVYDPINRLIGRSVNGQTDWTLYDGLDAWRDVKSDGSSLRYFYEAGVDRLIASSDGLERKWILNDLIGTTTAIVSDDNAVLEQRTYDSFGHTISGSGEHTRFGFTGRELETSYSEYYYRARNYDPLNGRFTAEDPLGFDAGDANLYRYVGNRPLQYRDPTGAVVLVGYISIQSSGQQEANAALIGGLLGFGVPNLIFVGEVLGLNAGEDLSVAVTRTSARVEELNCQLRQMVTAVGEAKAPPGVTGITNGFVNGASTSATVGIDLSGTIAGDIFDAVGLVENLACTANSILPSISRSEDLLSISGFSAASIVSIARIRSLINAQ